MARRYCYNDVLPLTAMVAIECTNVGLNVLFKKATSKGMSYFIFITYTYAIGALLLLPLSFLFPSGQVLPSLKFHLGFRIFLLGLIGFFAQVCAYTGIDYSNPTLASTISNLSPAFTFILAVLFRLERVALRSSTSQAKIMGTIASISGALLVVLYKGPQVFSSPSPSSTLLQPSYSNWVIGGILLAVAYLLFSIRYIIQGVLQAFSTFAISWGLHLKGPVYIAIFKPVSIAIAAFMSAIFLGDSLYLGSIIGAIIISIGFYAVIWGKAKEDERTTSSSKVPLLKVEENVE
ncbi:hypothetical protein ERO13_D04G053600v2 [Gossypium hirsutum]|uniref:WAT1-related protein n=1 Tax=Gossypium hirsutum TaxID=3635 RepID=A0A1U8LFU1_GOSHI|nr:WAT1-related protein At3g28050 isoform X3 [Gossypium raimondii]XP_016712248.1 WAT1-related protein At3g28050 isoform X3 [Gossypium hirsutum]KAG4151252.1 hypothetical protein ERO13_D04G053600v2 [Gossypium hirsutum]